MKVLIIAPLYAYSGDLSSSFVHNQICSLNKIVDAICVVVPTIFHGKKSANETRIIDGIEVHFIRVLSAGNFGEKTEVNSTLSYLCLKKPLLEIERSFNPDIVYAHTMRSEVIGALKYAQKRKIQVVTTIHGSDFSVPYLDGRYKHINNALSYSAVVISVGKTIFERIQQINPNINVEIVINGYNHKSIKEKKIQHLKVVQVSNLIPQKHVDITIKALAKIRQNYPETSLVIIGSGLEESNLKALVKELQMEENVSFCGRMANCQVLEILSSADYFVMPSVNEGFGIVYLEAMANKCVTIASKNEGIDGFIVHRQNGFLVTNDSIEEIVDVIKECELNPVFKEDIRLRGYNSANHQTWDKNAECVKKIFNKVLKSEK